MNSITSRENIAENLRYICKREAELERMRALVLEELVLPELPEAAQLRDIVRLWRRLNEGDAPDAASRTELCCRIYREYSPARLLFSRRDPLIDYLRSGEGTQPVISYVSNPYSEEARDRLLGAARLREHGCRSFSELCDDIGSGSCDGCIIPLENTSDGKLMGFYSIIDRFELKIFRTCDIESSDGTQSTRYALLTRYACPPQGEAAEHYLEVSLPVTNGAALRQLADAAARMSLELCRIDSVPQHYDEASATHYLVLRGKRDALLCFLLYLRLEHSGHTLIGLYDHI